MYLTRPGALQQTRYAREAGRIESPIPHEVEWCEGDVRT